MSALERLVGTAVIGIIVGILLGATVFHESFLGMLLYTILLLGILVVQILDASRLSKQKGV